MKFFLIFLYILFQMDVSGQDTVIWNLLKVDENLSVRLPGHIERVDTTINKNGKDFQSLIYRAQTADYNFGVTVTMMNSETGDYNAEQASEANRGTRVWNEEECGK